MNYASSSKPKSKPEQTRFAFKPPPLSGAPASRPSPLLSNGSDKICLKKPWLHEESVCDRDARPGPFAAGQGLDKSGKNCYNCIIPVVPCDISEHM